MTKTKMSQKNKRSKNLFLILTLVVTGFFALLTLFGEEGLLKLKKFYALKSKIRAENQEIFLANQKLQEEIRLLKEPVFAERLIREKLGYVKEREYILLLSDTAPESKPKAPVQSLSNPIEN